MFSKKEFWFALIMLFLDIAIITSWINDGYSSFKPCGLVVFTFIGIGFLRQARR